MHSLVLLIRAALQRADPTCSPSTSRVSVRMSAGAEGLTTEAARLVPPAYP
ncbi:hypothetical protein PF007_g4848 [Phytophthora fragariae]|uniref:Uncharacterized protein n=1 Tax=Phytophthora fragariae TaxID=53985 RepID=A0A6A3T4P8_9STRA|nr:hypothetical protein PF009_g6829 [Phytophthora fragariae]KAE9129534.1 hypothetical protein PF007_g4848 [Phytophthora fragariae]KAE9134266.1 hypothetical protein PF006_g14864 [Phytophthora fragariae]KAE9182950.1 hypothetical protein PF004_g24090 [Phytophthora fragariae]KAE9280428.1 hypothetical protein PF001_g24238 [Phytophthora fragariae]